MFDCFESNLLFLVKRQLVVTKGYRGDEEGLKHLLSLWDYEFDNDIDQVDHATQNLDEALQESCILGNVDLTTALIARGANIDAPDFEGKTSLMLALLYGNPGCALLLLNAGCDIRHRELIYGNQALSYALS